MRCWDTCTFAVRSRGTTVTVAEINEYYELHTDEYQRPARARWEQLSVRLISFHQKAAHAAIRGKWDARRTLVAVCKRLQESSQEPFASREDLHDGLPKVLASDPIDQQVFSIPLNAMSEIIEDQDITLLSA